jgi:predicted Zn finger-like uncharacterized protein
LYTQCIKCETVFRLSAEVLRAAGGQVRCGRCGEVFNALARLAEDPGAFPAGESPLEMEARANEILESTVPPLSQPGEGSARGDDIIEIEDFDSNDVDFARLQVVEKFTEQAAPPNPTASPGAVRGPPPALRASPHSSVSPAVKPAVGAPASAPARASAPKPKPAPATAPIIPPPSKPPAPARSKAAMPPAAPPKKPTITEDALQEPPGDGSMEFTLPPGELDRVFVGSKATAHAAAESSEASRQADALLEPGAGLEVPESVRRDMLSGIPDSAPPVLPEFSHSARRPMPSKIWAGSAILLALLLCMQLIHDNRDWLATHAPLRGSLRGIYAALGVAVTAPANLAAYQLRQWGVTGEPGASGTLRVRASILNTAAQLQPYPLLRVTLANRFGAKIGARDFEPAEYMGRPIVRMLAPGERADATLDIVDPGKDAEGFEIDVCVRGADQKISCAGDMAMQAKQPGSADRP